MNARIAVVGLGIIGSRAADCLTQAGYQVTTWNRTPKQRTDSEDSILDAVDRADVISLYLKDGHAVRDVFNDAKPRLTPDHIVLNHSTVDLDTTHWLHQECLKLGCGFLDAPFTGSKVAADEAALVYYIGGDTETLNRTEDILKATSKEIKHVGPVGNATVIKLATNLISASTALALSEALAIAKQNGVDPNVFTECVNSNACGSVLAAMKLPSMAAGDYDTHFSLENMLKDSRFALKLAKQAGLETPGIQTTSKAMEDRCEKGDAQLDFSALFKAYE